MLGGSEVSIDAGWFVLAAFCAAFGTSLWKFLPWAIRRALSEVITTQVKPETDKTHLAVAEIDLSIKAVNKRIDDHMASEERNLDAIEENTTALRNRLDMHVANEEASFDGLEASLAAQKVQLDDRTQLFDDLQATMETTQEVLTAHMASDEAQFSRSSTALEEGQRKLLDRLDAIERNTDTRPERR